MALPEGLCHQPPRQRHPWIVIGAGGHAVSVIDSLLAAGEQILGATDTSARGEILTIPILGSDQVIWNYSPEAVRLALGIGGSGANYAAIARRRSQLITQFIDAGYVFDIIQHPSALLARSSSLSPGCQLMAGAIVQASVTVGAHTIINTRACIDHNCSLGQFCHIGPGATLGGAVTVGDYAFVGLGAVILPGCTVGSRSVVGAGATVIRDVPPGKVVVGSPARELPSTF
jgi:sugar O-acyltransferase (sialic acid O-acetyltransferase NeuD family)